MLQRPHGNWPSKQQFGSAESQSIADPHARGLHPAEPHAVDAAPQHWDGAVQLAGPSHAPVMPSHASPAAMQRAGLIESRQQTWLLVQRTPEPHATPAEPAAEPPPQSPSTHGWPLGHACVASHLNVASAVGSPYVHAATAAEIQSALTRSPYHAAGWSSMRPWSARACAAWWSSPTDRRGVSARTGS